MRCFRVELAPIELDFRNIENSLRRSVVIRGRALGPVAGPSSAPAGRGKVSQVSTGRTRLIAWQERHPTRDVSVVLELTSCDIMGIHRGGGCRTVNLSVASPILDAAASAGAQPLCARDELPVCLGKSLPAHWVTGLWQSNQRHSILPFVAPPR